MSPQEIAKSIADELREQPELWVQGCGSTERGEPGCIMNHIAQRGADDYQLRHFWLAQIEEAEQVIPWDGATPSLSLWNDKPGRTARDIIALCDKVAAQS